MWSYRPGQGLYFGGHAGGAWGNTDLHDQFDYIGDPEFSSSSSSAGLIAGAQAGYNVQRGHFVFGLEGDLGYLGISASKTDSSKPSSSTQYLQRWPRPRSHWSRQEHPPCAMWMRNIRPPAICTATSPAASAMRGSYTLLREGWRCTLNETSSQIIPARTVKHSAPGLQWRRTIDVQFRPQRHTGGLDSWSWRRIRIEPLLVAQGRIPALRLRKHVDFV